MIEGVRELVSITLSSGLEDMLIAKSHLQIPKFG
jgi:hypothetical protein